MSISIQFRRRALFSVFAMIAGITQGSGALAQSEQIVTIDAQLKTVQLVNSQFEPVFETRQEPDTCYRDEVQGTKQECRTVWDQRCYTETFPSCTSITRRECSTQNQCTTVPDQVCNSNGCTTVPRRVCQPATVCRNVPDQVCHTQTRNRCVNEPRTVCNQVPNVVRVPYACTRPVQVQVGQRLVMKTVANLNLAFRYADGTGPNRDQFKIALPPQGEPLLNSESTADRYIYSSRILRKSVRAVSGDEQIVDYDIEVIGTPISIFGNVSAGRIDGIRLFSDRVEFVTPGLNLQSVPAKVRIELVRNPRIGGDTTLIDREIASRTLVVRGDTVVVPFQPYGVEPLKDRRFIVRVGIQIDESTLGKSIINGRVLSGLNRAPITGEFKGNPE